MQDEQAEWKYNANSGDELGYREDYEEIEPISWTASEYIAHEKTASWYVLLYLASLVITIIVYLLNRDIVTAVAILTITFAASFFASRKPESNTYELSEDGLTVNGRAYPYANFRSFSVVEEGAINSIWLKPLGRFAPFLIIYFEPADEPRIVNTLSNFLPHEVRQLDIIDRITKKLRF